MDAVWLYVPFSFLFAYLFSLLFHGRASKPLPPGPPSVPLLGNLLSFRRSFGDLENLLRELRGRYGGAPAVMLRTGARRTIFLFDRKLVHRAFIEHGPTFADRMPPHPAAAFVSANRHNINSSYGPLWRLLRRNLISEILHHSRAKVYASSREWVLGVLNQHLRSQAESNDGTVVAVESLRFAMFALLVLMCFGERLDEKSIKELEDVNRSVLLFLSKLNVLAIAPAITKYIFRGRVRTLLKMREKQTELFVPLIDARRERAKKLKEAGESEVPIFSYVDSLIGLKLSMEGDRPLTTAEIIALCGEFLNAGTDTSTTALHWIMARLVTHQDVQKKLAEEIEAVVGKEAPFVKEEDLPRMPYLKAVVMEGLRRHPPGHFLLPHRVTEDVTLDGYFIPEGTAVNVMMADVSWDETAWEDPMAFKPERFLPGGPGEGVDITGTKEIKMMPFGAGRRICPGLAAGMLHLEYFVANLVREFEWKTPVEGEKVDYSEMPEFTVAMKNPLRARIAPRRRRQT